MLRGIVVAAALAAAGMAYAAPAMVLVVRHAEKQAQPANDPPLTDLGKTRAQELARVVQALAAAGMPVRELFATEVQRTQQTLQPLAASLGIKVTVVNAKDTAELSRQILAVKGGLVVVAGHSNTVPGIVQALGGPSGIVIGDAEFDRLYVLTGAGSAAKVATLRYGLPSDPANASKM
jgi:phosphohistidine phosphatase SixA